MLSKRIKSLPNYPTQVINAKVLELRAKGENIIAFGKGETNFDIPEVSKEAVKKAIEDKVFGYTLCGGMPELTQAIIYKFKRDNNLDYRPENIISSTGGAQVLYQAFQVLIDEGDEIILPKPCWNGYPGQISLAGGVAVFCNVLPDCNMTAERIAPLITPKTKAIVLNSPNNPTGAMILKEELEKIAKLAIDNNLYIISDEVYEFFTYDDLKHTSIASINDDIKNRTITVNAISKTYGMTGWRLGYCGAREDIIDAMKKVQDRITANPCSLTQKAAIAALGQENSWVYNLVDVFEKKRDVLFQMIQEIPSFGLKEKPRGAFYAFPDVSEAYNDEVKNSTDFCSYVLEKAGVALVPGAGFGSDSHIRLAYTTSMEQLKEGMERLKKLFNK